MKKTTILQTTNNKVVEMISIQNNVCKTNKGKYKLTLKFGKA
jgi:hypothetical protein